MIADDDPGYLAAFCDGMQALGHSTHGELNGEAALQAFDNGEFDIVFLDVFMKGGGAVVLLHDVRKRNSDIPVVIITGKTEMVGSPLFESGLRLAQAKMRKTASLTELGQLVNRLTGSRS
nr:response regulator [Pseudooceanicola sp. HF7]